MRRMLRLLRSLFSVALAVFLPSLLARTRLIPPVILVLFALFCAVVLPACGGGPTSPSSSPGTGGPGPGAPPSSSALAISPSSATMSVGQSVVFTASGGDGYNYSFSAGPSGVLAWDQTTFNTVTVTLVNKGGLTSGWVNVIGYANGVVEKTVTVTFR